MKLHPRFIIGLLLLMMPLLALKCSKDEIVKANRFNVRVRVTGENLTGLGAEIKLESRLNIFNPTAGPALAHSYPTAVSQTYDLGTLGIQDDVTISAFFTNVTCSSTIQPASNSKLKVELLVNEVVVNTIELSPTSPRTAGFSCNPFWLITTVGSGDDWD